MKEQINFVVTRDGFDAGVFYAKQTLNAYRMAARQRKPKRHFAHILPFRPHFVISILEIRLFLKEIKMNAQQIANYIFGPVFFSCYNIVDIYVKDMTEEEQANFDEKPINLNAQELILSQLEENKHFYNFGENQAIKKAKQQLEQSEDLMSQVHKIVSNRCKVALLEYQNFGVE